MRRLLLIGLTALAWGLAPALRAHATAAPPAVSCAIHAALSPAACPATLRLPTLGVRVPLTAFPVADGTWQISPWERLPGHFQYTDWFGLGNAVVGGHATQPDGTPGVFHMLHTLQPGDPVWVHRPGNTTVYIVQRVYTTHYQDLSPVSPRHQWRLTLITCDPPSYDPARGGHDERVVVQAVRMP